MLPFTWQNPYTFRQVNSSPCSFPRISSGVRSSWGSPRNLARCLNSHSDTVFLMMRNGSQSDTVLRFGMVLAYSF